MHLNLRLDEPEFLEDYRNRDKGELLPAGSIRNQRLQSSIPMDESLRQLLEAARALRGAQNGQPSRHEYVEWAYGQAALENPAVTREIAEHAVDDLLDNKR